MHVCLHLTKFDAYVRTYIHPFIHTSIHVMNLTHLNRARKCMRSRTACPQRHKLPLLPLTELTGMLTNTCTYIHTHPLSLGIVDQLLDHVSLLHSHRIQVACLRRRIPARCHVCLYVCVCARVCLKVCSSSCKKSACTCQKKIDATIANAQNHAQTTSKDEANDTQGTFRDPTARSRACARRLCRHVSQRGSCPCARSAAPWRPCLCHP
jgi:hypothetical protein